MQLVGATSDNVERVHLSLLVIPAHVFVDIATQCAATLTIWALESRVLSADVQQMPAKAVLPLERAIACGTRMHPLSGEGLQFCHQKHMVT